MIIILISILHFYKFFKRFDFRIYNYLLSSVFSIKVMTFWKADRKKGGLVTIVTITLSKIKGDTSA